MTLLLNIDVGGIKLLFFRYLLENCHAIQGGVGEIQVLKEAIELTLKVLYGTIYFFFNLREGWRFSRRTIS